MPQSVQDMGHSVRKGDVVMLSYAFPADTSTTTCKPTFDDPNKASDVGYIEKVLNLLCPDGVFEIRSLNTPRATISGYFDNTKKAAAIAAELSGGVPGIYVTLNPVNPSLLPRSANRLTPYAKNTTADRHIIRRRCLPLDFDPARPAGISSTDEEHRLAIERAIEACDWLTSLGFPPGILADSGNGAHLLYLIDSANDKAATELIEATIKVIGDKFSDG